MRTYDDTFSGTKIYPGKVRFNPHQTDYPLRTLSGWSPMHSQALLANESTLNRANSMSVVIARSSGSNVERPNLFSCSGRILVG